MKSRLSSIYIIAEAGVNHCGDLNLARKLIKAASDCGADAIKFQTFKSELMSTSKAKKADYQNSGDGDVVSHQKMLKDLELPFEWHRELQQYANACGLDFLSSPFDLESLDLLLSLDVPLLKIPSGEVTNAPLLWRYGRSKKPVIMSTGMSNIDEITFALANVFFGRSSQNMPTSSREVWAFWNHMMQDNAALDDVCLLHCHSEYPTPLRSANMLAIESLRSHFNLPVGYSDHTEGQLMPIAAAALGARVIEKHFTIDRSLPGPDQNMSMEPADFKEMVQSIRQVELSLGNGDKVPQQGEVANIGIARQRIIATRCIKRDAIIMPEDITTSRCANGIFADKFWDITGSSAKADFKVGEAIEL